ncbi:MAG: hypothetical protein HeimC3_11490 [Candidatus Heimdallarchaeota archaeon LC_3]|nr:MAG: hypothetical protein HeimC3_11490 [Candidatus Heimdallarchaeota archaeon LC_3]
MVSLHSPVVHFPIGGLFITVFATVSGFILHLLISNDKIPEKILKVFGKDIVTKLDFVAHISGIIGLLGIIISTVSGILDAAGVESFIITDLNLFVIGITNSLSSSLLTYKIAMTLIAFNIFLVVGIIRLYFVTYKGNKHMYQTDITIQLIYVISIIYGFSFLILIGATGGLITSGSTILSQIPIINELLPGGSPIFLGLYIIGPSLLAISIILYKLLSNRKNINLSAS